MFINRGITCEGAEGVMSAVILGCLKQKLEITFPVFGVRDITFPFHQWARVYITCEGAEGVMSAIILSCSKQNPYITFLSIDVFTQGITCEAGWQQSLVDK